MMPMPALRKDDPHIPYEESPVGPRIFRCTETGGRLVEVARVRATRVSEVANDLFWENLRFVPRHARKDNVRVRRFLPDTDTPAGGEGEEDGIKKFDFALIYYAPEPDEQASA